LLSYTVTAAYTGVFVVILVAAGWIFTPQERKRLSLLALSLFVATLLSLLVYYGQWIPTMLNETLPTFTQAVQEQGKLTTLRPTLGSFLTANIGRAIQTYDLAIIFAMSLAGACLVLLSSRSLRSQSASSIMPPAIAFGLVAAPGVVRRRTITWQQLWLGAWLVTFPLFTLLDFWVDQALKEFWYALPAIAVVSAAWLLANLRRAGGSRVQRPYIWLLMMTLTWQSLSLWVFRLLFHNR